MDKLYLITLLFFQFFISAYSLCRPLDDVPFIGIFGKIYIREQLCSNSNFNEVRNYISQQIRNDGLLKIENSDIGSLKTELVTDVKASQIITFTCINCNINTIEKEGLKKLAKLYNLTLYGNNISQFDGTYIKNDNSRFQYLNLTNNNIKKVVNLCLGLPSIETIILRDNPIKTETENLFEGCKNLIYLDVSNTNIKLTKSIKDNIPKLDELYMQNINISSLDEIYLNLPNLTSLDVSFNNIKTINTILFELLPNLKILNINNNNINEIIYSPNVKDFPLKQLYLTNNNIRNITMVSLEYFKEIQTIDLSYNNITDIPVHFFEHCTDLRHLFLRNNQLKKLPVGVFSPSPNIVQLDLSYNNFSKFEDHLLYSLQFLEEFYISGNNLTSFEPYMLGSMVTTLKKLGVANLKWSCESVSYFVRFCKTHNIDYKPREKGNFKTSNVEGLVCSEKDGDRPYPTYRIQSGNEELNNITQKLLLDQLSFYKVQINEISSINVVLVFLTLFIMVFVVVKVITPVLMKIYNRYKTNRELLNSTNLNVSHLELVQNNAYGQNV